VTNLEGAVNAPASSVRETASNHNEDMVNSPASDARNIVGTHVEGIDTAPDSDVRDIASNHNEENTALPPPWPQLEIPRQASISASQRGLDDFKQIQRLAGLLMRLRTLSNSNGTATRTTVEDGIIEKISAMTPDELDNLIYQKRVELGADYDMSETTIQDRIRAGDLLPFDMKYASDCDALLEENGGNMDATLDKLMHRNKVRASERNIGTREEMQSYLDDNKVKNSKVVVDLMFDGQVTPTVEGFEPGGKGIPPVSDPKWIHIFIDDLQRRVLQGHFAVFSEDTIKKFEGVMDELHFSTLTWAPKARKAKGRVCFHASVVDKKCAHASLNACTDTEAMDQIYKAYSLTSLAKLAERYCRLKEKYGPDCLISGATCDIKNAYTQTPQGVASAKLHAFKIRIEHIVFVVLFLVGAWGATRAGHVFCTISAAIIALHNRQYWSEGPQEPQSGDLRSDAYIDDLTLIDRDEEIYKVGTNGKIEPGPSVLDIKECTTRIIGEGQIQDEKTKIYVGGLQSIGYELDLRKGIAMPLPKSINKAATRLFYDLPLGERETTVKHLEKTIGILLWCSACIPTGKCFLVQLFKHKAEADKSGNQTTLLSDLAISDIAMWRAIILVMMLDPSFLGAPLHRLRENLQPEIYIRTDSSFLGFGGAASYTPFKIDGVEVAPNEVPGTESEGHVRFTPLEKKYIKSLGVSINTLEFIAVCFYIFLWADKLTGKVVSIECDNIAAVSYLMKGRVKANWVADCIAKIFTLFILAYNITLVVNHVQGKLNTLADERSRLVGLHEAEIDEETFQTTLREQMEIMGDAKLVDEHVSNSVAEKGQARDQVGAKYSKSWLKTRVWLHALLTKQNRLPQLILPSVLTGVVSLIGNNRARSQEQTRC